LVPDLVPVLVPVSLLLAASFDAKTLNSAPCELEIIKMNFCCWLLPGLVLVEADYTKPAAKRKRKPEQQRS